MKLNQSLTIMLFVSTACYAMKMQDRSSSNKYIMPDSSEHVPTKKWRTSLTDLFDKESLKNRKPELISATVTKEDTSLIKGDDRRSKTIGKAADRKKTFSLIPKQKSVSVDASFDRLLTLFEPRPQVKAEDTQTNEEFKRILLKMSGEVATKQVPLSVEPDELGEVPVPQSQNADGRPSLSVSQVLLARNVKMRRDQYAKGRSGRDSQVKITAREYLGKQGEQALVYDSSEESNTGTDEKTSLTDEGISPRTNAPRLDQFMDE